MATRKARLQTVLARPSVVFPIARAIGPSVPAVLLEMPGSTSFQRTTIREYDCAPWITAPVAVDGDSQILVGRGVSVSPDTRIRVLWPVSLDGDSLVRVEGGLVGLCDTRISTFRGFEGSGDTKALVVWPLSVDLDSSQRIFSVSHISADADTCVRVLHMVRINLDTWILSVLGIDQMGDVALYLRRPVYSDHDAHQEIFAVLIRESHVIQT